MNIRKRENTENMENKKYAKKGKEEKMDSYRGINPIPYDITQNS